MKGGGVPFFSPEAGGKFGKACVPRLRRLQNVGVCGRNESGSRGGGRRGEKEKKRSSVDINPVGCGRHCRRARVLTVSSLSFSTGLLFLSLHPNITLELLRFSSIAKRQKGKKLMCWLGLTNVCLERLGRRKSAVPLMRNGVDTRRQYFREMILRG